ncbi:MAG: redox-regulated ATPase YchF [Candidatus Pacebacteria bacterium]|nr:redox-regulated ATPase YchF [Candidatus Paceibacterota bacterium]
MSFSVGIVGLPNVGKSTLFKALTKKKVDIAAYPFTTIHPNYGTVSVPDERLEKIAQIIKPEKVTPTIIEFVDIAGLVKGAHKGEGLGNQFLAHIRNCDAILEVIRVFENPNVENVLGEINPEKEIEIVKVELLMKDLETLENLISKVQKDTKRDKKVFKKLEFLEKIKEAVSQGKLISEIDLIEEEKLEIKEYQFLTQKPIFYVLNINDTGKQNLVTLKAKFLVMNLKDEEEILELSGSEIKELKLKSQLDQLILGCYNALSLITFFTIAGGKETRAWTVKRQTPTPQAGAKVHSDFEKKFIRAEVIPWQKLVEAKSWVKARELGWLRTVGKDYLVEDGDIIEFKI